ncbi:hypothetical protein [Sphingomonas sp.]|uniref:hypothetical protein n=1 Tax=Sphingomonas sp. TaxID=28214 RepID=UPI002DD624FC|nr:hypothetical protein [Sphingomonas sp.]
MAAQLLPDRLKIPLAPAFAIVVGGGIALACMLVPQGILEIAVLDSGLPALLPAAEPPLGWTARTALAMTLGGAGGAAAWLGAFLLLGGEGVVTLRPSGRPLREVLDEPVPARPKSTKSRATAFIRERISALTARRVTAPPDSNVPVLRRADAHPDAPPRAPLNAGAELGTPFLAVKAARPPVERDLPRDLDAPLAAFDPDAIPEVPADPARPLAQLAPRTGVAIHAKGERFEAFELPRPAPIAGATPIAAPRTDATIHALLDRLERGVAQRDATKDERRSAAG